MSAILVMGVSGSGKSTVGSALASKINCAFLDADDYHPEANVEKMRRGEPLNDDDRAPWLAHLNALLHQVSNEGKTVVLACSALKQRYRLALAANVDLRIVHLAGSPEAIGARLSGRQHRYMPATLLASQFEALEVPSDALAVDVNLSVAAIVERIVLGLPAHPPAASPK